MNRNYLNNFIDYFSKKISLTNLNKLNIRHNIDSNYVELYHDFVISLTYIINETYLGDDFIKNENDIKSHFKWCWLKNINNFKKEKIYIKESGAHYQYYFDYFYQIYYISEKSDHLIKEIVEFWGLIFTLNKTKTMSQYDIFLEIYQIFNKYFTNRLDIVK